MSKTYIREYELLQDLPTGEKKGDHFFFHVSNNVDAKIWYQKGRLSEFNKTKWHQDWSSNGSKLDINQMTATFFKPITEPKDLYPTFPAIEEIKELYYLIGESRVVNSDDRVRAINEIYYSDEFYNDVYELLKKKYNEKHGY